MKPPYPAHMEYGHDRWFELLEDIELGYDDGPEPHQVVIEKAELIETQLEAA